MMRQGELSDRRLIGVAMAGVVLIWLGNLAGWWWLASLIGLCLGFLLPARRGMLTAGCSGAGGWALGLVWVAIHDPIGPTAQALTEMLGLGSSAIVSLFLTVLLGMLLALSGAWLGSALRVVSRQSEDSYS